ncbi:hypothetical protein GQ457_04G014330 [Hibiscus cannabinus]
MIEGKASTKVPQKPSNKHNGTYQRSSNLHQRGEWKDYINQHQQKNDRDESSRHETPRKKKKPKRKIGGQRATHHPIPLDRDPTLSMFSSLPPLAMAQTETAEASETQENIDAFKTYQTGEI